MEADRSPQTWGLVLAGGDGTRMQTITRALTGAPIPKQYCRIVGERSLLETTLARIAPLVPRTRTLVIVNRDHLPIAADQLRGLPAENVLVQPSNRDTGPGLLWSLLHLARHRSDGLVAVFPSDHWIQDESGFLAHLEDAIGLARRLPDKIVLLGMPPDRAEPGLGYIEPGEPFARAGRGAAFHVAAFHEKPRAEDVVRIIDRGGLWNSFIMVFAFRRALELLRAVRPTDYERLEHGEAAHGCLPAWNFSRDFLARVPEHLVALRVSGIGWSDWGTPEAIERTLALLKREPPWRTVHRATAVR